MKISIKIGIIGSVASIAAFLGLGLSADSSETSAASSVATENYTSGVAVTPSEGCVVRADANGSTVSCGSTKTGTAVSSSASEKKPANSTKTE